MRWRPHTEIPEGSATFSALIALPPDADEDKYAFSSYIWQWDPLSKKWVTESTLLPCRYSAFYWIPESELLAPLEQAEDGGVDLILRSCAAALEREACAIGDAARNYPPGSAWAFGSIARVMRETAGELRAGRVPEHWGGGSW